MAISKLSIYYRKAITWYGRRSDSSIDMVAIHVTGGGGTVEQIVNLFSRRIGSSCNYAIGEDGRIGCCLDETIASCCTSNKSVDKRAITIEVANDGGANTGYHISDAAWNALVDLLVDICKRHKNKIPELRWLANKNVLWKPEKQNVMVHRWFAKKACPGDYIYNNLGKICDEVNARLKSQE